MLLHHKIRVFSISCSCGSGEPFPAQSVELFHYLTDFLFHALACFALSGEPHKADLGLSLPEIDLPFLLFILCNANAVFVVAALHFIKTGGNQMIFEKLL